MSHRRQTVITTTGPPLNLTLQIKVGGLFDALFLQRRVLDGRPEEKDQRPIARVPVAVEPEPVDRYIRVTSRDHNCSGVVRMVQSVRAKSFWQAKIQEFRVNIIIYNMFLDDFIVSNNNL